MGAEPLSQADVASTYILLAAEQFNIGACWIHIRNRAGQHLSADKEVVHNSTVARNLPELPVSDLEQCLIKT